MSPSGGIPPCFNLHAEKFGQASASSSPERRDSSPPGGYPPPSALACRLAVVTGHAKRLQVVGEIAGTTVLHRHHVVHDTRRHQSASHAARPTQGVLTQEGRAHQTPLSGLVEADLRIKASPRASVVAVNEGLMGRAVAWLCQHRCTPRISTWCRGAARHRKSLQKDAEHPQIRLGFLRGQSVHTNTINHP